MISSLLAVVQKNGYLPQGPEIQILKNHSDEFQGHEWERVRGNGGVPDLVFHLTQSLYRVI